MTEQKKVKVEFAPGAFDDFEGTQEELDELMQEIYGMFEGKTHEELEAMSRPLGDLDDIPEEVLEQLMKLEDPSKRKLQ